MINLPPFWWPVADVALIRIVELEYKTEMSYNDLIISEKCVTSAYMHMHKTDALTRGHMQQ